MILYSGVLILAIDPGHTKVGWAVVSEQGTPYAQGIVRSASWESELAQHVDLPRITAVVIGDGTNRVNIEQSIERLAVNARVAVVDERESTVDAWRLKRSEVAGGNPFISFWFTLNQLFSPAPVDDYAARVLAERFIAKRDAED